MKTEMSMKMAMRAQMERGMEPRIGMKLEMRMGLKIGMGMATVHRSTRTPHIHVLACICSNVRQFSMTFVFHTTLPYVHS